MNRCIAGRLPKDTVSINLPCLIYYKRLNIFPFFASPYPQGNSTYFHLSMIFQNHSLEVIGPASYVTSCAAQVADGKHYCILSSLWWHVGKEDKIYEEIFRGRENFHNTSIG